MRVEGLSSSKTSHFSVILEVRHADELFRHFYLSSDIFINLWVETILISASRFSTLRQHFSWLISKGLLGMLQSTSRYHICAIPAYSLFHSSISFSAITLEKKNICLQFYKSFCSNLDDIIWKPPTESTKTRMANSKSKKR